MSQMPFYGRAAEREALLQNLAAVTAGESRLIVIEGRRRIGKTRLIQQTLAASPIPVISFYVNDRMGRASNAARFRERLSEAIELPEKTSGFTSMAQILAVLAEHPHKTPFVLVIDEIQHCNAVEPGFYAELMRFWKANRKTAQILLILTESTACAEAFSHQTERSALYRLAESRLRLAPFTTEELRQVLTEAVPQATVSELLRLYAITGGIPGYVEYLLQENPQTADDLLHAALKTDSPLLNEGLLLIGQSFRTDYADYFELLTRIAAGTSERTELMAHVSGKDTANLLRRLEDFYGLIVKDEPAQTPKKYKAVQYRIADAFLTFWFAFVCPRADLVENEQSGRLFDEIRAELSVFEERMLAAWFRQRLRETGRYREVAAWRDSRGGNAIDLVAVNAADKTVTFADVRLREPADPDTLRQKSLHFLLQSGSCAGFDCRCLCLTGEDMLSESLLRPSP